MKERILLAYLLELGKTPEEVAAKLEELGIKGKRGSCVTCPIAEYLAGKLEQSVEVVHGFIALLSSNTAYDFPEETYPELAGVWTFINHFDLGSYPRLCRED